MITVEHTPTTVSTAVLGAYTLEDFREFEDYLVANNLFDGTHSLLFDLREMGGFTIDLALEEIKFTRFHGGDFKRIAVVSDSQWVAWSAWIEQLFVSAAVQVFADVDAARAWLAEPA